MNYIFGNKLFISCVLIAPSLLYVLLYTARYALFLVIGLLILQVREIEAISLQQYIVQAVFSIFGILIVAYALQKREIERFYEDQKFKCQTKQICTILHTHNEAVLVISSEIKEDSKSEDADSQDEKIDSIVNFELCNEKSAQLFGQDFKPK